MNRKGKGSGWFMKKAALFLIMSLMLGSIQMVYAQESDSGLRSEIAAKRAMGAEIYEIEDSNGTILGYYEPYSETNPSPAASTNIAYSINWSAPKNTDTWSDRNVSMLKGDKMSFNISQNPSGPGYSGYIGLRNNDNGTFGYTKVSTNGWNGTITAGFNGHFSLAIRNASVYTITYSGTYSF